MIRRDLQSIERIFFSDVMPRSLPETTQFYRLSTVYSVLLNCSLFVPRMKREGISWSLTLETLQHDSYVVSHISLTASNNKVSRIFLFSTLDSRTPSCKSCPSFFTKNTVGSATALTKQESSSSLFYVKSSSMESFFLLWNFSSHDLLVERQSFLASFLEKNT